MQNLVRGRGLLCRSLMKSQMASPTFTPIFAALVSVINTKFPEIGELLLHRLILQASSPAQPLPHFRYRLQQHIACHFRSTRWISIIYRFTMSNPSQICLNIRHKKFVAYAD